ncbi:hypothetical protein AAFF_G00406980 [Aldrovandia affinis]|uniref:Uncharacterized protein n=1 Tax=Aldrovandia affinis TaxID=143900 RepID=A0AAD7SCR8_9TELE|nr:hypothetical protein AAFF_G00406980 [Aldrovandia affinis]
MAGQAPSGKSEPASVSPPDSAEHQVHRGPEFPPKEEALKAWAQESSQTYGWPQSVRQWSGLVMVANSCTYLQ